MKHLIVLTIVKLRYINFYTSTDGLVGYDDRFTRDRSRVQLPVGVFLVRIDNDLKAYSLSYSIFPASKALT